MVDVSKLFEETFFGPIIIYFPFLKSFKIFTYKNDIVNVASE